MAEPKPVVIRISKESLAKAKRAEIRQIGWLRGVQKQMKMVGSLSKDSFIAYVESLAELEERLSAISEIVRQLDWQKSLIGNLPQFSWFSEFNRASEWIARSLKGIDFAATHSVGAQKSFCDPLFAFDDSLVTMSRAFASIHKEMTDSINTGTEMPSVILKRPHRELYSTILSRRCSERDYELSEDESQFLDGSCSDEYFYQRLYKLDPSLVVLFDAACIALKDSNPDKARHAASSLRALFEAVLNALVPRNDFSAWEAEREQELSGVRLRERMLRYIYRGPFSGDFASFVNADISSAKTFCSVLNKQLHSSRLRLSEVELHMLILRAKGVIITLIEAADNCTSTK